MTTLPRSTGYDHPEPRPLRRQRSSRLLVLGVLLATVAALLMGADGAFITGSDILMDGGVTASYFYGELAPR